MAARKHSAHRMNAATYCAGERIVIASRTLEMGASRSYRSDVRSIAAGGGSGFAMATSGGKEKTAVLPRGAVLTGGHPDPDTRRSLNLCNRLAGKVQSSLC